MAIVTLRDALDSALKAVLILVAIYISFQSAMVHFPRRIAQHARYNLLRNVPAAPIHLQKTARQRAKDIHAARIDRSWPITRANKMSRGLLNSGNDCFRNSGLQALMHAPKFLNWIRSHNVTLTDGTRQFGCQTPSATQRALERKSMIDSYEPGSRSTPLADCPACVMKALVQGYWGNRNLRHDGRPYYLNAQTREFTELVRVDAVVSQFSPQSGYDGQQQDPEEFQTRFLAACLESVDYR